jgi:hypothetical protein
MKSEMLIEFEFVDYIPEEMEEKVLYVSRKYETAVHKCFCGCGREVVTPLSATGWKLTFDGETVSLYPSVGSWSLPCQSHYFITRNRVEWAPRWSREQIEHSRAREALERQQYYEQINKKQATLWQRLKKWLFK